MTLRLCLTLLASAAILTATGANAQEREWSWDMTDQDAFLVYGTPDTDDVGLSFWCKLGSGKISFMSTEPRGLGKAGQRTRISIELDGQKFEFNAKATTTSTGSIVSHETEIPAANKLFAALSHADYIAVHAGGHTSTVPLVDASFDRLVSVCATVAN